MGQHRQEEAWKTEVREGLRILANTMAEEIAQAMESKGAYEPGLIRGLVRYIITAERGEVREKARINPGDLVEVYDSIDQTSYIGVAEGLWEAYGYQLVKVTNPRGDMDYYPTCGVLTVVVQMFDNTVRVRYRFEDVPENRPRWP